MSPIAANELILMRHAPADHGGRMAGRRDVPAVLPPSEDLEPLRQWLAVAQVVASPALRCFATAKALFPGVDFPTDARLWEQDFGVEEGVAFEDLPDLGPLPRTALAERAAEGGESFARMVARVTPALLDLAQAAKLNGPVAVVAHAGTVRAGLALALDDVPAALTFEVAPLSVTRLRCLDDGFSIIATNAQMV